MQKGSLLLCVASLGIAWVHASTTSAGYCCPQITVALGTEEDGTYTFLTEGNEPASDKCTNACLYRKDSNRTATYCFEEVEDNGSGQVQCEAISPPALNGPTTEELLKKIEDLQKVVTEFQAPLTYTVVTQKLPWSEAKAYCEARGGSLAKPDSQEKNDQIIAKLQDIQEQYWFGLRKMANGQWQYTDGSAMVFTDWGSDPSQPSGDGDCVDYMTYANYPWVWNDASCNTPYYFICESPKVPRTLWCGYASINGLTQNTVLSFDNVVDELSSGTSKGALGKDGVFVPEVAGTYLITLTSNVVTEAGHGLVGQIITSAAVPFFYVEKASGGTIRTQVAASRYVKMAFGDSLYINLTPLRNDAVDINDINLCVSLVDAA